ncbi:TPA: transcription termination/antitermination protein NusG [bacterium]|nr:transcription termination/antitermination protein NusG [bacterium]
MGWYIIHTYSGQENSVRANILSRLKATGKEDEVSQIFIPTEEVSEIRGGKKRIITRKFFPGYLLIEMEMNDETWHIIRHTPGVFGFIGTGLKPSPLEKEEVDELFSRIKEGSGKIKPKVVLQVNESVRVIDGPFTNFMGVIRDVDLKRERLHIMVNILGRATPLELEFYQVERL